MAQVEDFEWINKHYAELQKKYPNMYVAPPGGYYIIAYDPVLGGIVSIIAGLINVIRSL